MKKLYTAVICITLLSLLLCQVAVAAESDLSDVGSDAVSDGESMLEEAATDIKDMVDGSEGFLDPENGEPEAEEDGIVDDDKDDKNDRVTDKADSENSTDRADGTTDSDRADESTGVIEGMELEENGINPWAIAIAVIVIISVLVLIFILIPKRR
ncbi:MAG: hypothetical protein IKL24_01395 [Clostridia bacterium]|nr:hypothetical protein [Clostridia bacterium]